MRTQWNTAYYDPQYVPPVEKRQYTAEDGTQTVMAVLIALHGGYSKTCDIACATGRSVKTVHLVLKGLMELGVVTVHKPAKNQFGGGNLAFDFGVAYAQD